MSPVGRAVGARAVAKAASRLKFPQLFTVLLVLFVLDLLIPDLIPFVDELLLGLGTALVGSWREKAPPSKPPEKDVTGRGSHRPR